MRILIAEDDPSSREFLFMLLKRYGECDLAIDGFEALDAFLISVNENNPYDLLCIDIMMPKFDGLKVLKAIRDIEIQRNTLPERRVKIIITTALDISKNARSSFKLEYDAFIPKPINTVNLLEVLQTMGLIADNTKGEQR